MTALFTEDEIQDRLSRIPIIPVESDDLAQNLYGPSDFLTVVCSDRDDLIEIMADAVLLAVGGFDDRRYIRLQAADDGTLWGEFVPTVLSRGSGYGFDPEWHAFPQRIAWRNGSRAFAPGIGQGIKIRGAMYHASFCLDVHKYWRPTHFNTNTTRTEFERNFGRPLHYSITATRLWFEYDVLGPQIVGTTPSGALPDVLRALAGSGVGLDAIRVLTV